MCPCFGSFSVGPFPNRAGELSQHMALPCSFPGGGCDPSGVDALVAVVADHEGLASAHGHQTNPRAPIWSPWLVEVGEFTDVVDL